EARTFVSCSPRQICPLTPILLGQLPDTLSKQRVVAYHYGLEAAYDLLGKEVRPYLIVGAGAVSYDQPGSVETDFALGFGAGVKIYLGRRVGARLEGVDRLIPNHFLTDKPEHDVQVRGGIVFRLE